MVPAAELSIETDIWFTPPFEVQTVSCLVAALTENFFWASSVFLPFFERAYSLKVNDSSAIFLGKE